MPIAPAVAAALIGLGGTGLKAGLDAATQDPPAPPPPPPPQPPQQVAASSDFENKVMEIVRASLLGERATDEEENRSPTLTA